MKILRYILVAAIAIPNAACGQKTDSVDEEVKTLYSNTVPVVLKKDAEKWTTAVLLDTREIEEFEVSHLPNATMVGYDNFKMKSVAKIDKKDTIIVYCSIGYRSEKIGEKLQKAGYENVYNLYGGIFDWKNKDGVVVTSKKDTTEKVHTYNKSWSRFLKNGEKVY